MSLQIFIVPSGDCIVPDSIPTTLEDLRAYLSKATSIRPQDQILLTSKGKHVKLQNFLTEACPTMVPLV